jgi:hypothetical protein
MLKVKSKLPEEYQNASFKYSNLGYYAWPVTMIVASIIYIIVVAKTDFTAFIVGAVSIAVIYIISKLIIIRKNHS